MTGEFGRRLWAAGYGRDVRPVTTLFEADRRRGGGGAAGGAAPDALRMLRAATASPARPEGGWEAALVAAVWEAVRTRRLSAADRYVAHRAYPAPRGIFAADAAIELVRPDGGVARLRFDPMTSNGSPFPAPDERWRRARVVIRCDGWRYPTPYGGLRPTLALLESGHLAATIALCAHRAGLGLRADVVPEDPDVVVAFDVDPERAEDGGPGGLDACVDRCGDGMPLKTWLDRRSSGWSDENLVTSRAVDGARAAAVAAALASALATIGPATPFALPEGAIGVHEHWLDGGLLDGKRRRPLAAGGPGHPAGLGHPAELGHPMSADTRFVSTHGFTFTADPAVIHAAHGDRATTVLPAALGWAAQWACLAGAARGLSVRPARNYDDAEWAIGLGLDPEVLPVYQLWLRPLPDEAAAPWSLMGVAV